MPAFIHPYSRRGGGSMARQLVRLGASSVRSASKRTTRHCASKKRAGSPPALIAHHVPSSCSFLTPVGRRHMMRLFAHGKARVEFAHFFGYAAILEFAHREHGWSRETLRPNLGSFG